MHRQMTMKSVSPSLLYWQISGSMKWIMNSKSEGMMS